MLSDEHEGYESNKQQVCENEIDMLTMRDTEAHEWMGRGTYYGVRYDAASEELHRRHENHQYYPSNQLWCPPNHSNLISLMIAQ